MADDKPKRFNPAETEKPLFTAAKGAAVNSDSPPPNEDKPLFRAVKGATGNADSTPDTEIRPRFRAVSGALNNSDIDQDEEDTPLFRAASSDSGDSDADNREEENPYFQAAAFRDETQSSGGTHKNDDKPLFRAVNPGSVSGASSASSDTYRSEEWKDELTAFVTIVRCLAYRKSLELTQSLGGGIKASPNNDSKPNKPTGGPNISPKSGCVTLLLCLFLGFLGAHRFYTGYIGMGFLYLFTGGLFLIGWIIDLFNILSGFFRDSKERLIKW